MAAKSRVQSKTLGQLYYYYNAFIKRMLFLFASSNIEKDVRI